MISRRQIIRGQQEPTSGQQQKLTQTGASSSSSGASSSTQQSGASSKSGRNQTVAGNNQQAASAKMKQPGQKMQHNQQLQQQQQQDSSDGYVASSHRYQYEDYVDDHDQINNRGNNAAASARDYWRQQHHETATGGADGYRHFDPYSIYSEEEDVWYSEERLFEDHLEEIFNKWRLLDDDIWCKLIIMERNRRIGKAYARVPIVTIDGSHELSYDGYKLALNGFDNPDRDPKTEECRKRIGKGIRIKMDNFGNILIKRLSKSNVYIKEWLQLGSSESGGGIGGGNSVPCSQVQSSADSNGGRLMPSRQQLIKNQNAILARSGLVVGSSQVSTSSLHTSSVTPSNSSSGGSSMEHSNDSAICDEVISVGGRLDQDKIYVMFDIKKFQTNITQELCRPYPDKRKLEQQCFSIIGLARDAEEILNLPCWVMVINIVAIQILNERFPLMSDHHHHSSFPDTILLEGVANNNNNGPTRRGGGGGHFQTPSFVSIFEQNNNSNSERYLKDDGVNNNNKEEDPYSLPANASSSDVKSSINDYGTASTKNISLLMDSSNGSSNGHHQMMPSRYYAGSKRADMYAHKKELSSASRHQHQHQHQQHLNINDSGHNQQHAISDNIKYRSKSNCNIYGPDLSATKMNGNGRYNNNTSIYSPGHLLVPPSGDSVPPKLPPRDFVRKIKSKSSSNVSQDGGGYSQSPTATGRQHQDLEAEAIYSTGMLTPSSGTGNLCDQQNLEINTKLRKTKKNRFLESLKAPLELAKSSTNRSASVMGAPINSLSGASELTTTSVVDKKTANNNKSSKGAFNRTSATKNLKSFLGVSGNKQKATKDTISDYSSNYVHVDEVLKKNSTTTRHNSSDNGVEVDSVVDSNENIDHDHSNHQRTIATNSSSSASYNDLDIPTPDYETDENIYAIEDSNYSRGGSYNVNNGNRVRASGVNDKQLKCATNTKLRNGNGISINNKEDLYYSGFRAHVPQNGPSNRSVLSSGKQILEDKMSCLSLRENCRFAMHNNNSSGSKMNSSKLSGRDMIYGSTTGLPSMASAGSRYRSASMQRYYPRSSQLAVKSQTQIYDPDSENPYGMGGSSMTGITSNTSTTTTTTTTTAAAALVDLQNHYGVTGHRRRSNSKQLMANPFAMASGTGGSSHLLGKSGGGGCNRVITSSNGMVNSSNYDVGRSSSGIYGNNSSGSSSDYADWHPHMRKVNSSGYLNSIFKSHLASPSMMDSSSPSQQQQHQPSYSTNLLNNNNGVNSTMAAHGYNNNSKHSKQQQHQQRQLSRTLKVAAANRPASTISKQQQQKSQQEGPTYRSYESSNDSEPSYTNSSDGLDIYDHIGTRLNHHHHHNQFLNMPTGRSVASEVHVGEWENMYDR